jgi:NAD-dependent deacetylase sirtuin 2
MGTSLQVHPFSSLVETPPVGTPRILINREMAGVSTSDWDNGFKFSDPDSSDAFLKGDCDDGCLKLATMLGWKDELIELKRRDHNT